MEFQDFDKLSNAKLNEIKNNAEKQFIDIRTEIDRLCNELIEIENFYLKADEELKKRQNIGNNG